VIVAACGGDGDPSAGDLSGEFIAAAQDAADQSLLTIDDFPAGWVGATGAEDDDDSATLKLGPDCDVLLGNLGDFRDEVSSADSDDFSGPNDEDVSSGAAVFASEDAAQEAVNAINDAVDMCRSEFEEALLAFFRTSLEEDPDIDRALLDEVVVEVSFADLAFKELGDATNAYRLDILVTIEDETLEPAADIVLMRQGRLTAGLFYFALERPPIEREEALAETIVRRMREADAGLPD
jgi:hypothetical protein